MGKERTDKSRYQSRYGGGYITAAQYIVECLAFLIARQNKEELYDNFWKNEPWTKLFREQVPAANKLLVDYSSEAILAMLRDKRCWKIRSLRAKSMFEHILKQKAREAELKNKQEEGAVIQEKLDVMQRPPKRSGPSSSLISKLKGL